MAVEAKGQNTVSGMPQLLAYLAGIHDARYGRPNTTVFGILSDGDAFKFACLNDDKKLFISRTYEWGYEQASILSQLDEVLLDAIHSSPHTAPVKTRNAIINRYGRWLESKWDFGGGAGDDAEDGECETEVEDLAEVVEVVKKQNGRIVLESRPVPTDKQSIQN